MTTTTATAPKYIARDAYTGSYTRSLRTAANLGQRPATFTAEELHAALPTEGGVLWESFGHVNGVEKFGRNRVIPGVDGVYVYNSDGGLVLIHPLGRGRTIRALGRAS